VSKATDKLRQAVTESGLLTEVKKVFGFAFSTNISEKDGKLIIQFAQQDSGNDVMTLDDLSAMLQIDRSALKDMTEVRAQRTDKYPIPFFKVGRNTRFMRDKIIEWREKLQADQEQAIQIPALHKGKKKRVAVQ
jgi:hypothetical protein